MKTLLIAAVLSVPLLANAQDVPEDVAAECRQLPDADQQQACLDANAPESIEASTRAAAQRAAMAGYYQRVAKTLAQRGGERDLAMAALFQGLAQWNSEPVAVTEARISGQRPEPDAQAVRWLEQAAVRGAQSSDALLQTLLVAGAEVVGDDAARSRAAARWQEIEPDNLAARFAGPDFDAGMLQAAGQATRHVTYFYPRVRALAQALASTPMTSDERDSLLRDGKDEKSTSLIAAFGIEGAIALPAYQSLFQSCGAEAGAVELQVCRRIAEVMADEGDTALAESIGIGLQTRVASNSGERAAAQQRQRRFQWQLQQRFRLERADETVFPRAFSDPALTSERELTRRVLQQAGVAPDPPAGWVPSSP